MGGCHFAALIVGMLLPVHVASQKGSLVKPTAWTEMKHARMRGLDQDAAHFVILVYSARGADHCRRLWVAVAREIEIWQADDLVTRVVRFAGMVLGVEEA